MSSKRQAECILPDKLLLVVEIEKMINGYYSVFQGRLPNQHRQYIFPLHRFCLSEYMKTYSRSAVIIIGIVTDECVKLTFFFYLTDFNGFVNEHSERNRNLDYHCYGEEYCKYFLRIAVFLLSPFDLFCKKEIDRKECNADKKKHYTCDEHICIYDNDQ